MKQIVVSCTHDGSASDYQAMVDAGLVTAQTLDGDSSNMQCGVGADASGTNSTAMGTDAKAAGTQATATGDSSNATGNNATAIGANTSVVGIYSTGLGANAVITGNYSTGVGADVTISGDNSTGVGAKITISSDNSTALGSYSTVTGVSGTALGYGTTVTGYNSVALGAGSVATEDNIVSVGTAEHTRRITNVTAGEKDTDAVNVSQLRDATQNATQEARRFSREARAGIAGANAAAALAQAYTPGKSLVALGAGTYKGESALALGVSRISDNGKVILKFQGNTNSRGDYGAGASVGYQW